MGNRRTVVLNFFLVLLLVTASSALPSDIGPPQNPGANLGCPGGCNNVAVRELVGDSSGLMGYSSDGSSASSVTVGIGFAMTFLMFLSLL
ncbi:hypothetical protein BJ322DRAFT_1109933 [Thelephora terrestris]|uniref:Uncharacterized protein n=1 Tax=Thelephora terrestris TaxID=56493 RepID=A0A9P6HCF6_9AGAM|nr:hypothetical protein BJ322DRAFT_1109933 [Thelephora terrestris]